MWFELLETCFVKLCWVDVFVFGTAFFSVCLHCGGWVCFFIMCIVFVFMVLSTLRFAHVKEP